MAADLRVTVLARLVIRVPPIGFFPPLLPRRLALKLVTSPLLTGPLSLEAQTSLKLANLPWVSNSGPQSKSGGGGEMFVCCGLGQEKGGKMACPAQGVSGKLPQTPCPGHASFPTFTWPKPQHAYVFPPRTRIEVCPTLMLSAPRNSCPVFDTSHWGHVPFLSGSNSPDRIQIHTPTSQGVPVSSQLSLVGWPPFLTSCRLV